MMGEPTPMRSKREGNEDMEEDGEDVEDLGDAEERTARRGQVVTVRLVARSGSSSISMTIE